MLQVGVCEARYQGFPPQAQAARPRYNAVIQLLIGLGLGLLIAGLGYWRRALSRSGALAAVVVGAVVFGLGGLAWGVLLVAFFSSSSLLSSYSPARKAQVVEKFEKGSRRDATQVLANGGWVTLLAVLAWFRPAPWLFPAAVGALAAANADTWATELGVLSPTPPHLITTGEPVPPGTSGAVSRLGTMAALTGALFIGFVATATAVAGYAGPRFDQPPAWSGLFGTAGGLVGALFDSVLGATVQRINYCPRCEEETERRIHRCGTATSPLRGWPWLDNDWVNFLATVAGSLVAGLLATVVR